MVQARSWSQLLQRGTVTVEGMEITLRKQGIASILDIVSHLPELGDAIEVLANGKLKGGGDKLQVTSEVLAQVSAETGQSEGKVARKLVATLPGLLVDLIVESTVLASEDERADYREWVLALGPSSLQDLLSGWVKLNLPEFYGPFVEGVAKVLQFGDSLLKALPGRAAAAPAPENSAPAAADQTVPAAA